MNRSAERGRSPIEDAMWISHGIPLPTPEHKFCADRRWRFDRAWPEYKVSLEKEGGVWARGRHVRPAGYLGDMDKYNRAALDGWIVLRFDTRRWMSSEMFDAVLCGLRQRGLAPGFIRITYGIAGPRKR